MSKAKRQIKLGKVCINHAGIELPNIPMTATILA
jgi:hypothetical protein